MEPKTTVVLADKLHKLENEKRSLETQIELAKSALAQALVQEDKEVTLGSYGQKYKLYRPAARYTFNLPVEEFLANGILEDCTPAPKLTKTKLDELLKTRRLEDDTVAEWQRKGWYVIERSDEIGVRQVSTKLEDLQNALQGSADGAAQGF